MELHYIARVFRQSGGRICITHLMVVAADQLFKGLELPVGGGEMVQLLSQVVQSGFVLLLLAIQSSQFTLQNVLDSRQRLGRHVWSNFFPLELSSYYGVDC